MNSMIVNLRVDGKPRNYEIPPISNVEMRANQCQQNYMDQLKLRIEWSPGRLKFSSYIYKNCLD